MCGILVVVKSLGVAMDAGTLARMRDVCTHRGPDDHGLVTLGRSSTRGWAPALEAANSSWEVALAHRRLSIIDLSPMGHQPMVYRDRFWTVFNGEIYNYLELRDELRRLGHEFRSTSDTEVLLAAYAEWGTECFKRFRGMWGLVIFDSARGEIVLSRDRLGIKPLYWWSGNEILAVASEIKQFASFPGFAPRLDAEAGREYLLTGYEDPGRSFFRGVRPVPAGTWLSVPVGKRDPSPPNPFWQPERVVVSVTDDAQAALLFSDKLRECVRLHLRSDVPVGCALSGGLDSSAIAILAGEMKERGDGMFHTFTSTFPGESVDERAWADSVAAVVETVPHHVVPDPEQFLEEFDRFLWVHDEPVGSLSVYASYCVARLTREAGVSVTLNGQGGDEILSGYWQSYYMHLRSLFKRWRLGELAGHFTGALSRDGNPALLGQAPVMLRRYLSRSRPSALLRLRNRAEAQRPVLDDVMALDEPARRVHEIRSLFLPRLLKWDDRNSMAFSVEGRYPFLDHELIELCLSFDSRTLYRHGWTKWPLRLGLGGVLPAAVARRRTKLGFEVPQDRWLRGPLRPELTRWLTGDHPAWDHVDREDVRRLTERLWRSDRGDSEAGQAVFRVYALDRWLERFGVSA